jgi:hypothetical protein
LKRQAAPTLSNIDSSRPRRRELSAEIPPLWLELYSHGIGSSLDSCGCDEFEEAVLAADELVAQAKELHQSDWPKFGLN